MLSFYTVLKRDGLDLTLIKQKQLYQAQLEASINYLIEETSIVMVSNQNYQVQVQEFLDQLQVLILASKEALKTSSSKKIKQSDIITLDLMQARDLNQLTHGQLLLILSDLTDIRKTLNTCIEKEQKLMGLSSRIGDLNCSQNDNIQGSNISGNKRSPIKKYQPPQRIQSTSTLQSNQQNTFALNSINESQNPQLKQQLDFYQQQCKQLQQQQIIQQQNAQKQLHDIENQYKEMISQKEIIISTLNCQIRNMEQQSVELQQKWEISQQQQQEYDLKISQLEQQIQNLMAISQQHICQSDNAKQLNSDLVKQQEEQKVREMQFLQQKSQMQQQIQHLQINNSDLQTLNHQNELKLADLQRQLEKQQKQHMEQLEAQNTQIVSLRRQNDELNILLKKYQVDLTNATTTAKLAEERRKQIETSLQLAQTQHYQQRRQSIENQQKFEAPQKTAASPRTVENEWETTDAQQSGFEIQNDLKQQFNDQVMYKETLNQAIQPKPLPVESEKLTSLKNFIEIKEPENSASVQSAPGNSNSLPGGAFLTGVSTETPQSQQQVIKPAPNIDENTNNLAINKQDEQNNNIPKKLVNTQVSVINSQVDDQSTQLKSVSQISLQNSQNNGIQQLNDINLAQKLQENVGNKLFEDTEVKQEVNKQEIVATQQSNEQQSKHDEIDLEADFDIELDLDQDPTKSDVVQNPIVKTSTGLKTFTIQDPQSMIEKESIQPKNNENDTVNKSKVLENDIFNDYDVTDEKQSIQQINQIQVLKPNIDESMELEIDASVGSQKEQNPIIVQSTVQEPQSDQKQPLIDNVIDLGVDFDDLDIEYNNVIVPNKPITEEKKDDFDALLDPFNDKSKKKSKKKKKQSKPVNQVNDLDLGDDDMNFSL